MSCPHGNHHNGCDICNEVDAAYNSGVEHTKKALAAQPALVVAAQKVMEEFGTASDSLQELYQTLKPYTTPPAQPAQQEPDDEKVDCPRCGHCCPQRQPLTNEQIGKILDDPNIAEKHQGNWLVLPYAYARAIETAHNITGEKK